ncbi:MAG: CapA family protein [Lachnospiraceae bacterium]|nr:CapA family protein [Lachnospiraceae bacterium]
MTVLLLYALWYRGFFLPSFITWEEKEESCLFASEQADIRLSGKKVTVSLAEKPVWESPEGALVSDFLTGDINHDGVNELILLFWRHGSFKEHLPFWIKQNDRDWSQHIGVYGWKESYDYRLDPLWVTSALGMEVTALSLDEQGVLTVSHAGGEETDWYWRTWGLMRLNEGEKPFSPRNTAEEKTSPAARAEDDEKEEKISIRFAACGDNLIHESIWKAAKERALSADTEPASLYDFSYAYEDTADFFRQQDLCFINMETLVSDTLPPSDYPYFSTPGACAEALAACGFNVFNLSNNHIYDQGLKGLQATEAFWEKLSQQKKGEILTCGLFAATEKDPVPCFDCQGVRIAFLGYTYGTNDIETPEGAQWSVIYLSETDRIRKQLQKAREQADFVIVSCHFGTEGSHQITDDKRSTARTLCDWGADLVIGTHPHVVQDAQWFQTKDGRRALVCYSLGNFISSMKYTAALTGVTLSCRLDCTKKENRCQVSIREARLIPTVTTYGPYYHEPRVRFLADYSREEATANRKAYRDPDYSYDRILEILKDHVSEEFLDLSGVEE